MSLIQLGLPRQVPLVRVKRPLRVFLMEANVVMGSFRYLPYSTGLLRSYAETKPEIRAGCVFAPFIYELDRLDKVVSKYDEPDVAAFSVSMWNEQLSLKVANEVKKRYPRCLVVFGGCQVPHHPEAYMQQFPFIDICVRAEGEEAFTDILLHYLDGSDFSGIPEVSYRTPDGFVENSGCRDSIKDLDRYPSPYLVGLFDEVIKNQTESHQFQCIIESNRGCSFPCSFCYWGRGGLTTKYRFHSMDYVKEEIDFVGKNQLIYCFGADANFGMHPRDKEIAEHMVATKRQYGYPHRFRVCFGKNTDDKIFQVASILHEAELEKGITLARQSNDETTLKNIRRNNIKLSTYQNLQKRFMDKSVPTYTELILGLPGETITSWKKGIDEILTSGNLRANLFCYMCQILPNTELWREDYRKKHGIKSKLVELTEIHGSSRSSDLVTEYEELVIATDTLPYDDWRYLCKFSWMAMLLHSMKAGYFVMGWLWDEFDIPPSEFISAVLAYKKEGSPIVKEMAIWEDLLDRVSLFGQSRGQILDGYGDVYWDVEEAALLRLLEDKKFFEPFGDLDSITRELLQSKNIEINWPKFYDIQTYQNWRMPCSNWWARISTEFLYNTPEYFEKLSGNHPISLEKSPCWCSFSMKDYQGNKEKFARETILWGRKSGTMLTQVEWEGQQ